MRPRSAGIAVHAATLPSLPSFLDVTATTVDERYWVPLG